MGRQSLCTSALLSVSVTSSLCVGRPLHVSPSLLEKREGMQRGKYKMGEVKLVFTLIFNVSCPAVYCRAGERVAEALPAQGCLPH